MMNTRLSKMLVALLAVATAGACDDPPIEPGDNDPARLFTSSSVVVVEAGASSLVRAHLVNDLGNPLTGDVAFSACDAKISVAADPAQTAVEPGTNFLVTGVTLGESCVNVSAAGFEETITVRVVPAELSVTASPDTVRAGEAGAIDLETRTTAGTFVGPFADTDVTFESSDEDRLFFTDEEGGFDTEEAGPVTVTATFESFGVEREVEIPITVIPGLPAEGSFATELGATGVGDTTSATVELQDTIGNLNDLAADIDSIVVTSSDEGVATAFATVSENADLEGRVILTVFAEGVSGGTADISATVFTVTGAIDVGSSTVTVLSPSLVSAAPNSGQPGQVVVLAGSGLATDGFTTNVLLDGTDITMFVDDITATAITLDMPGATVDGEHELTVTVGGVSSNAVTWTQTDFQDVRGPENEDASTAPLLTLPIDIAGTLRGDNANDFYRFTLAAETTMTFRLNWNNSKDLDLLFRNSTNTAFVCSFGAATGSRPENASCTLAAGTYIIWINDYSSDHDGDTSPVSYELRASGS